MAVLLEGQKLPIASKADSGKSVVFVKLTDSALRSLEEYFKHRVNYLRLPHFNHITAPQWRKISSNPINCFYHSSPNCAQSQISKWENFQQICEILMFQHILPPGSVQIEFGQLLRLLFMILKPKYCLSFKVEREFPFFSSAPLKRNQKLASATLVKRPKYPWSQIMQHTIKQKLWG